MGLPLQDVTLFSGGDTSEEGGAGDKHHSSGDIVVMFVSVAILFGVFLRTLGQRFKFFRFLPYTVSLLILGLVFAIAALYGDIGNFEDAIDIIDRMDPHLFLLVFLPSLIFESAFSVNFHIIKREATQALVLAGPGVVISMILVALVARYVFPYEWGWNESLMFGAMLSATDPVAVVALLREVGASKRLGTLIEAESLFNDGTAYVFFLIWKDFVVGNERTPGKVAEFLLRLSLGGTALGLGIGLVMVFWIANVINSPTIETSITFATAYFSFWLAESEDVAMHVSGVLAVVALGLTASRFKAYISVGSVETMHAFWEMVSFLVNTLIFFISGILVAKRLFRDSNYLQAADFGWLIVLYILLHVIRAVMVFILYPALSCLGYGIDYKIASVLVYGGLRGAVSLALALIVDLDSEIPRSIRDRVLFHTAGIVLLTILINGSTTKYLLRFLGLTDTRAPERRAFRQALTTISEKSDETTLHLRKTKEYDGTNWASVAAILPKYQKQARELAVCANRPGDAFLLTDDEFMRFGRARRRSTLNLLDMQDIHQISGPEMKEEMYHRVLTAIKADFWCGHEDGLSSAHTVALLDEAAETALDLSSVRILWKVLNVEGFCKMPFWFVCIENCLPWIAQRYLYSRLFTAAEIVLAVRHACHVARHLDHFFCRGDGKADEYFNEVIKEVEEILVKADETWKEANNCFPEVMCAMKTEKAARVVLKKEEKAIKLLGEEGILQERERDMMLKLVGKSKFCIETHALGSNRPNESDAIRALHLWRYLPEKDRRLLLHSHRKVYDKGERVGSSNSHGLYVILEGMADIREGERDIVTDVLAKSSSWGMYSTCTGKPHLGTVVARSSPLIVAHLGFESSKRFLKHSAASVCWRLAGAEILKFDHSLFVQRFSRDALEAICIRSTLKPFENCRKYSITAPTLILKGSAESSYSGMTFSERALLRPSCLCADEMKGDSNFALDTMRASQKKAKEYEFAEGSIVLILDALKRETIQGRRATSVSTFNEKKREKRSFTKARSLDRLTIISMPPEKNEEKMEMKTISINPNANFLLDPSLNAHKGTRQRTSISVDGRGSIEERDYST
ncbi:hypothetical protein AAMO2058_001370100 [Amorphochlora amoebiformis]